MKKDLIINNTASSFDYSRDKDGQVFISIGGENFNFEKKANESGAALWNTNQGLAKTWANGGDISVGHSDIRVTDPKNQKRIKGAHTDSGGMTSPMPGKILKVFVQVGSSVKQGHPLIVMEAMKMEHTIKASESGTISTLNCSEGRLVDGGVTLCIIEPLGKDT